MWMTGADFRDVSPNAPPEPVPGHASALAASPERVQPCPTDLGSEHAEPFQAPGDRMVVQVALHPRLSQAPISEMDAWRRFIRPCRMAFSVARMREAMVKRRIVAEFCNPASGWEKGQIEKNVRGTPAIGSGSRCPTSPPWRR